MSKYTLKQTYNKKKKISIRQTQQMEQILSIKANIRNGKKVSKQTQKIEQISIKIKLNTWKK